MNEKYKNLSKIETRNDAVQRHSMDIQRPIYHPFNSNRLLFDFASFPPELSALACRAN